VPAWQGNPPYESENTETEKSYRIGPLIGAICQCTE